MDSNKFQKECQGNGSQGRQSAVDKSEDNLGKNNFLVYAHAIAERKYVDEKLRETVKELSALKFALDQSAIVAIADTQQIISYVNDNFCEISKYSRNELLGKSYALINSGDHCL